MNNGTYHRDLPGGIPEKALWTFVGDRLLLSYSRHAMLAAIDDRYSHRASWQAPRELFLRVEQIVEATLENGAAVKAVVRVNLDATRDLVLVLQQPDEHGRVFVRTLWINDREDRHSTLDRKNYAN